MSDRTVISVFVAEDEQPAIELLVEYIGAHPGLKLEGIASNGREALRKLSANPSDLLFLDIDLPVMSGLEVLERLAAPPRVIFTTAYDQYAIRAFELGAADYLLKPFSFERFRTAVDRACATLREGSRPTPAPQRIGLSFRERGTHRIIPYEDIVYVSSNGRTTIVHTENKSFDTNLLLKQVGMRLPSEGFIRIHKQYIVNLRHVSHFKYFIGGQYILHLNDEEQTTLTVGQAYAQALKERLGV
ncbi:MAG TPA: LytTR family DNA-binding domain-containing protein [Spirochaetota bacterium]|nr:LytTR family DNA-binding domain-containing protein [Spirochaetota bacterium]HPI23283.1 LytTR family DNA-binding domain-containing protein [Spirochaetota bacterium]HPU87428.1 LytTR family DNA-binding domain-containing protein [Spirochaetota bacterium]